MAAAGQKWVAARTGCAVRHPGGSSQGGVAFWAQLVSWRARLQQRLRRCEVPRLGCLQQRCKARPIHSIRRRASCQQALDAARLVAAGGQEERRRAALCACVHRSARCDQIFY